MTYQIALLELMGKRGLSYAELSGKTGIEIAKLEQAAEGKCGAIHLSSLAVLCETLQCEPNDLLRKTKE